MTEDGAALILAAAAGTLALAAYTLWAIDMAKARRPAWAIYFVALLAAETLFTLIYIVGLSYSPDPSPLPFGLIEFFLRWAVPTSVGLSAAGWLIARVIRRGGNLGPFGSTKPGR